MPVVLYPPENIATYLSRYI